MAQSELELMSPGASEPTVSDSSASQTSGQNFGRTFFSHLQLAGGPDTVPDQCTLEPTVFRAPIHVSGETWRGGESSDGIVCSEGDVIYDATTTPQMQKLQYPVSQGISGSPLTSVPLLFPFPGTQVISEAQAKAMMIPAANPAMRPILTFGGAPAAAIRPSSSRTLLGPEMELLNASRPKRRNERKDPQSVAARHRRERISDRIRVLQSLVPGGTKMDTASILDEAIHYVKFLQLQLQVLGQLGNSFDSKAYNQVAHDECPSADVLHLSSTTGSDHHITGWSSRTALSSMCLPDHAQEREPQTAIKASLQAATEERGLRAAAEPQQCWLGSTCSDSQNMDALLEGVEVAFSDIENLQVETGPNYTFSTGKTLADLAEANGHGGIAGFLAEANLMRALSSMIISNNPMGIAMAELSRRESNSRSMNEDEESSVVESLLADWNAARAGALINTAFQQCSAQKWEEDLLASIQVNEFSMTPHWYKEVTHTAPKYKGVAHMNELDKGSSDSEGGDANGGGHDIQMTQQEQQGLDGKKIQSQEDMLNQSGHRTKRHTCHEQTSTNTKSSGSRDLERVTAKRVKILEDPSEQQKLLPSTGINETVQNRLLELERASILIVGRKDIQGDFVEFQFLSPESMARVVGVGLQWSRVVVTRQFNVIVTYVGNKAWLNFWKETRQNKDSKMFTLLRGTIPRVSTKLEAVSNLTAKESSRRFGVGLEEFKSEIHNLYVKDNTKQNGMLPLIFELAKQMGVSGENARNSGKQHSGASSSGYAGGKSDDKRPANPKGKTQIPGDGNLEDKEGEESEFPSSNPSKLPAEPPLDTKKNKSLTVTVIPESGGTFHQRSTNDLAYPEGPVQHATIVPWLQFKFEMLGDYDDRRITTTTTTQCNLGGGEPKYPDLDCGYYHDNITISLNCEKQKAARLKSATVDATNSSKRTISTTFTGSRSSANQISGQFGGTFQIPIVDIGVQAQGNVSRIGTVGDSDSLANSNETLNNLLGGFYVNPAELEGNLIYNFLHPEDIGELLLKNCKQFLHSGTCRTFWPTIIGEWDTLDMDETCMYSFKTERDITSVKDLMRSNVARNIPYYMRQRYQVPLYVNHAMTHIHCYETTTLQGAGEQRLEHVLIKYPAF